MAKPVFATNDVPTAQQVNQWFVNGPYARKTVFEDVTANTALQNDDELFVSVLANTVYEVRMVLFYDGDPGGDLKIQFTAPSGAVLPFAASGMAVTAAGYGDDQVGAFDLTTATVGFGAIGVGTTCGLIVAGTLVTSGTAGTLQLQWAQRTAFATRTRIFQNSFLSLMSVG